ncbi:hypothetical protein F2Q70_00013278 [Brassica cretica]|uniref:Uncharacterized protein n=1 Tax=Brassica cretica TaxID=69181 RepID=A0A8S9JKM0_BRACR|nr:hypothetical protein F2Q68_00006344 [Brassica cretica]KAF2610084.1 hypothetical protein F2Q70_00013278 [Brassica cretica]
MHTSLNHGNQPRVSGPVVKLNLESHGFECRWEPSWMPRRALRLSSGGRSLALVGSSRGFEFGSCLLREREYTPSRLDLVAVARSRCRRSISLPSLSLDLVAVVVARSRRVVVAIARLEL